MLGANIDVEQRAVFSLVAQRPFPYFASNQRSPQTPVQLAFVAATLEDEWIAPALELYWSVFRTWRRPLRRNPLPASEPLDSALTPLPDLRERATPLRAPVVN